MKQEISAHITPAQGQISAHVALIDYQSQNAQTSAQIVRKKRYAIITLSSYYTSHAKQKKCERTQTGQLAFLPSNYYPVYYTLLYYRPIPTVNNMCIFT